MKILVIGGTGPTGPHLVNGLLSHGHEVIILHSGRHEVEFDQEIEHIHTDPHFAETLAPALEGRKFDLVIATYGRTAIIAEVVKGKTERFIAVSGAGAYAAMHDPRWGPMGRPVSIREDSPLRTSAGEDDKLFHKIYLTEQAIMALHESGDFQAAIFRYPLVYGPNSPANSDWSIVKRILDGRKRFILSDGGLVVQRRGFSTNIAHCMLLAVERPEKISGKIYHICDDKQYTIRRRVEIITKALNHQWELVNLPHELARRTSPLWNAAEHFIFDNSKIRNDLDYQDLVPPHEAIVQSAHWLAENGPSHAVELERQLGDPFAYDAEDQLMDTSRHLGLSAANNVEFPAIGSSHMYRHPRKPGEDWKPRT